MPKFITKAEAASMLRLSIPTLARLINEGKLKVYKIGRLVRIDEASIVEMLEGSIKGGAECPK